MQSLDQWSSWIKEGHFLSYKYENARYYEFVLRRDMGHWEYDWEESISTLTESGPYVPANLEITQGYDKVNNLNRIWQMIFGIKTQIYIYIELPTDTHRHGIPKQAKPSSVNRQVSHFAEWMSPFMSPSFITEFFLMKDAGINQIGFDAYNPTDITLTPTLNVFLNKMVTERLGSEFEGKLTPTKQRFSEVLDKLHRRVIPHRPLTLFPIQSRAAA